MQKEKIALIIGGKIKNPRGTIIKQVQVLRATIMQEAVEIAPEFGEKADSRGIVCPSGTIPELVKVYHSSHYPSDSPSSIFSRRCSTPKSTAASRPASSVWSNHEILHVDNRAFLQAAFELPLREYVYHGIRGFESSSTASRPNDISYSGGPDPPICCAEKLFHLHAALGQRDAFFIHQQARDNARVQPQAQGEKPAAQDGAQSVRGRGAGRQSRRDHHRVQLQGQRYVRAPAGGNLGMRHRGFDLQLHQMEGGLSKGRAASRIRLSKCPT
jgi:hypothetical protein